MFAAPAHAAFPGANGKIVFHTPPVEGDPFYRVHTIAPDGSGRTFLFAGQDAAWSANGQRLAFAKGNDVYTARPDGTELFQLTQRPCNQDYCITSVGASWSPDGNRLSLSNVFSVWPQGSFYISVINADGTGEQDIASDAFGPAWSPDGSTIAFDGISTMTPEGTNRTDLVDGGHPSWSPDGSRIAFYRSSAIWVMNSDGTNPEQVTPPPNLGTDRDPAWSPDGSKLAFVRQENNAKTDLFTINVDGTGRTNITNTPNLDEESPDWQPLDTGYARPKGATPVNVRFVPAYDQCSGASPPGSTHGPPLAVPSCQPPRQSSLYLTMGTGDSNGKASQFLGGLSVKQICNPACSNPGDQADVKLDAQLTDVRNVPDLTDYLGELQVNVILRMTDRTNGAGGTEPGTAVDVPFSFAVPCSGDLDTTIGSTCNVSTTADAVIPGIVPEGKRAVWGLGQVEVYDGGPDGVAATSDNTLFAVQGLFAP